MISRVGSGRPARPAGKDAMAKTAARKPAALRAGPTRRRAKPAAPKRPKAAARLEALIYRPIWRVVDVRKIYLGTSRCSGLTVEHQQQTQWCWAAVSNSVSHYYDPGSTWTQCTIANAELGQTGCCTNGSSAACNKPWYLDKALTRVGCFQSIASGTLSFATIRSLIGAARPPCARQAWSGGGAHFMAITCCYEGILGLLGESGSMAKRLKITDPWYGDSIVDYTTFVSGYQGTGSWTHSYRTEP
jgi:hypothetical protein